MLEEMLTRGTPLNQTLLWILFIAFMVLLVWTLVDIVIWCLRWAKGEDDEKSAFDGDDDRRDDDCGFTGSRAG